MFSDIFNWPLLVPDNLRVDLIKSGNKAYQNKDEPFVSIKRQGDETNDTNRQLMSDWFYISQSIDEKIPTAWRAYSVKN